LTERPLLEVRDLTVSFATEAGRARVVNGIGFALGKGQTLGIVGESGCGKSVTAFSLMRLLPRPSGVIEKGEVVLGGTDLLKLPAAEMPKIRGRRISMIFQEPMTALNPVHAIGRQIAEVLELHRPELGREGTIKECIALLDRVGISEARQRLKVYPHELSGGMRQRVMIAIALACRPEILIADEPTTALDVTMQAQILELIQELQQETGMAILFITHDLGVVSELCDDVMVMYAGRIVERARAERLFATPRHPYTKGLLTSIPRLSGQRKAKLQTIEGMVPGLMDMPPGCPFQNRCPHAIDVCKKVVPPLEAAGDGQEVACHRWREVSA
jgi:peptide/nickel transport system ATP-binding protein